MTWFNADKVAELSNAISTITDPGEENAWFDALPMATQDSIMDLDGRIGEAVFAQVGMELDEADTALAAQLLAQMY